MKNLNGMMVICGNSIEELERGLAALKASLATGKIAGIGGTSIEELEQGMGLLTQMVDTETNATRDKAEVVSTGEVKIVSAKTLEADHTFEKMQAYANNPPIGAHIVQRMIEAYERSLDEK